MRFEDVRYGEDGYFNRLTTFCAENIVLVPEYLIVHRTHSANLSSTFNADNCNMTERIMVQREELIRRGASEKNSAVFNESLADGCLLPQVSLSVYEREEKLCQGLFCSEKTLEILSKRLYL